MTQLHGNKCYMGYRIKSLEIIDDNHSEIVLAPLPKPKVRARLATSDVPKMISACFLSDICEYNADTCELLIAGRSCALESFEEIES